jgi:alpha-L-fucosidase 2
VAYLSTTATINIALIKDLFPHVIGAAKILNMDQDFGAKLTDALTKIPPYSVTSDGNLKTWVEDWKI